MKCFNRFTILAQSALFFAKLGYQRVNINDLFRYGKIAAEILNEPWFHGFDIWDILDSVESFPYFFNYKDDEFYIATCEFNIYKMEEFFSYGLPDNVLSQFDKINKMFYESFDKSDIKEVYGPKEDGIILVYKPEFNYVGISEFTYKKRDN